MNEYEVKLEERRRRYLERAERADSAGNAGYAEAKKIMSFIPPGQPILVGHHSEKRHRADLKRIDGAMRRSIEGAEKADYYREKAEAVGKGGISADDPDACAKLRAELDEMEARRSILKKVNAVLRKGTAPDDIPEMTEAMKKDLAFVFRIGQAPRKEVKGRTVCWFPGYYLSNLGANIRRVRQRIASLERLEATESRPDIDGQGYTIREDADENRIFVEFDAKPPRETCRLMRSNGWRWSRARGAWCRMLNDAGRASAGRLHRIFSR